MARSLRVRQPIVTDIYQIGVEGGGVGPVFPTGRGTGPDTNIPRTRFSVRWEGNRLVIETGNYSGPTREAGPYPEHVEVWQLDAGETPFTMWDNTWVS